MALKETPVGEKGVCRVLFRKNLQSSKNVSAVIRPQSRMKDFKSDGSRGSLTAKGNTVNMKRYGDKLSSP